MKKSLLFVMDSLGIGGGEKSLVTLLSLIDYTKYDVDLQLFSNGGEFVQFLPKEVKLLPLLPYNRFLNNGLIKSLFSFKLSYIKARIKYSYKIHRYKLTHAAKAMTYWQTCSSCYNSTKHYDIAIAYSQGLPTFYVIDKVNAEKKIGWVNVDYKMDDELKTYTYNYYNAIDDIVTVSDNTHKYFEGLFPQFKDKIHTIYDIINNKLIHSMSMNGGLFTYNTDFSIVTLARLNHQKGFDISLNACKILKSRGYIFQWHVFGNGPERGNMLSFIKENELDNFFIIHQPVANPYQFLANATIYVQTSRNEGYGISIAEARILNKPVVTTEYTAVWSQMVQGKNGIVVPIDATAVADAIEDLILHPEKRDAITASQPTEKKGNTEEIEKFYKLLE